MLREDAGTLPSRLEGSVSASIAAACPRGSQTRTTGAVHSPHGSLCTPITLQATISRRSSLLQQTCFE